MDGSKKMGCTFPAEAFFSDDQHPPVECGGAFDLLIPLADLRVQCTQTSIRAQPPYAGRSRSREIVSTATGIGPLRVGSEADAEFVGFLRVLAKRIWDKGSLA